jgi:prepilin-type N-terminal cleavage/methylation domain-containing protein
MKRHQSGFTLIEIAIVLVIIGLLLGGVLKGQELITQAKVKNVANDFNAVSVGVLGYQDRYKRLPGDDGTVTSRWGASAPLGTGGTLNDGIISGDYDAPNTSTTESNAFWSHLRLAGFIGGDTSTTTEAIKQPLNAVGGILGVQRSVPGLAGHSVCSSNLTGKIANAVDSQFDDGKPDSGSVRGFPAPVTGAALATATPSSAYTDDSSTMYLVCRAL